MLALVLVGARAAYAPNDIVRAQMHFRCEIVRPHRLVEKQCRAQVLLVVIRKDRRDHGVRAQLILQQQRAQEIRAGRDADAEAELRGQRTRHEYRVAIRNGDGTVEKVEIDDRRDELVGHTLNAVLAYLGARGQRG